MTEQKSIFITGGGSGVGRAIAQRFSKEGWFVGIADVNEEGMKKTAELLPEGSFTKHYLDVREPSAWERVLADFTHNRDGKLNVLANNAGVALGGKLVELTTEEIGRTLEVNLNGVIYGARAAHPYLKAAAPDSCLVNTCSAAGIYGQSGMTIYCASKFGVRAITESLDIEWDEDEIKVTDVMPGYIDTPLLGHGSHTGSNAPIRDSVQDAGLEFTPVSEVADEFWDAVHGTELHNTVGKTAVTVSLAARWMPSYVRHRARQMAKEGKKLMG